MTCESKAVSDPGQPGSVRINVCNPTYAETANDHTWYQTWYRCYTCQLCFVSCLMHPCTKSYHTRGTWHQT